MPQTFTPAPTQFGASNALLAELARILKLDRPIRAMSLDLAIGQSAVVSVEFLASVEDTERMAAALKAHRETDECANR